MCFFVFCTKFYTKKIVKWGFFDITIMEKKIAFCDCDMLNSNPVSLSKIISHNKNLFNTFSNIHNPKWRLFLHILIYRFLRIKNVILWQVKNFFISILKCRSFCWLQCWMLCQKHDLFLDLKCCQHFLMFNNFNKSIPQKKNASCFAISHIFVKKYFFFTFFCL